MIAALFVETGGPYFSLDGVDPWDEPRDARSYEGPHAVVAHPPCQRWGRYWHGGPSARVRRIKGNDDGCFAAALASVRKWGGVLEHPEGSAAWAAFGISRPPKSGGWVIGDWEGMTCCVEQGHYGHRARKATWLYAVRCELPSLIWGPCAGKERMDEGWHSTEARRAARAAGVAPSKRLSERERIHTPIAFRDILIDMARSVPC
jgi:hypothetical protein